MRGDRNVDLCETDLGGSALRLASFLSRLAVRREFYLKVSTLQGYPCGLRDGLAGSLRKRRGHEEALLFREIRLRQSPSE